MIQYNEGLDALAFNSLTSQFQLNMFWLPLPSIALYTLCLAACTLLCHWGATWRMFQHVQLVQQALVLQTLLWHDAAGG
jgi:hypothetical protein